MYEYRSSRACRIVENVFHILASRFLILLNSINVSSGKDSTVVPEFPHLHSYLIWKNGETWIWGSIDVEDINSQGLRSGNWRSNHNKLHALQFWFQFNQIGKVNKRKILLLFNNAVSVPWQEELPNL
jgi:hypothetical protein